MINKRVLALAFELLSLLVVIRVSAHAVGYSIDVFDGTTPVIDGELASGEWNDASTLSFNFTLVHLKHDANNLYIAFNISDATPDPHAEGLYLGLDTSNDGGPILNQSDDIMMGTFRNGTPFETDAMGPLPPGPGWNVSVFEEADGYTVEFNVTYGRIGITPGENTTLGLLLLCFDTDFGPSIWPTGLMNPANPSNWGDMMVVFQIEPIYIRPDGSVEGSDKIVSWDNITYTFTSDISAPIIVQRNNTVIDGDGWTLDGVDFAIWEGFSLTDVSNVTIVNVNIESFASYSIYLESASQCVISRNTVVGSEGGIGLFFSTESTVSNNAITGCSEAVELVYSSGNVVSGNNLTDNNSGVYLVSSAGNTVNGNNMTANSGLGVLVTGSSTFNIISGNYIAFSEGNINLWNSSNNEIVGNIIAHGAEAIQLWSSHNNTILNNSMTNNGRGVWVRSGSAENVILGNNITDNTYSGIDISGSNSTTISRNLLVNNTDAISAVGASSTTITGNMMAENRQNGVAFDNAGYNLVCSNEIKTSSINGIFIEGDQSAFNVFYHNNIVDNTNAVEIQMSLQGYPPNTWDNGIEGNYWSNYADPDANHDGIGDSPHVLNQNNTDNAPLMGPFNSFNTSLGKIVNVISNSTVAGLEYESPDTIRFTVSNMTGNQTHGFCRVTIPHDVLSPPYNVTVNGVDPTYVNYTLHDNGTHSWIYFEYGHSTVEVVIIPEFPVFAILPLLMALASLATLACRRNHT